jgi:hypothetical protein
MEKSGRVVKDNRFPDTIKSGGNDEKARLDA